MVVYDENGHRIEDYNLSKGYLENKSEAVEHRWVVDSEEQGEWVTLREYPETGGKDVEWRVTAEEQGHWKTVKDGGKEVADFDGTLSDDWPHDVPVPDIFEYAIYHQYTEEELEEREKQRQEAEYASRQAMQLRAATLFFVRTNANGLSDEDAQGFDTLFPDWKVGGNYEQGDILRYNGGLYRVSQKATCAQADHTPDKAVSLYKKIGEPTGGLFPWSQPQGAHDAYEKGDKVSHNGKTWVSTVDDNVWEPGVYGWEEAKE